jgi:hypothetical protein
MATMAADVKLGLVIRPVYWSTLPKIKIMFNETTLFDDVLEDVLDLNWTLPASYNNRLSVFMLNKQDSDSVDGKDKAVVIEAVAIEGYRYQSFLNQAKYQPIYSKGYYEYAEKNNTQVTPLIQSNYLGFNGEWFLEMTWPVFSWIYELETNGQGWVYEKNI